MGKQPRTKAEQRRAEARARKLDAEAENSGRPPRPESYQLAPEKEAAFWRLVEALGLDPRLGVYPLVNRTLAGGGGLRGHATGHLAARDLKEALGKGLPVQFERRPSLQPHRG